MYFQKITVQISQCPLLEMRHLLVGMVMCFSHLLKGRSYGVCPQNCLTALRSFHRRGLHPGARGARLPIHMKEGGRTPQDWLLLHI